MNKIKLKVLDLYLQYPITWDLSVVSLLWLSKVFVSYCCYEFLNESDTLNLISNIIGTCVSLAGFILAALTIIVTFRANVKNKRIEEAENAMDLILSSHHYEEIVKVFQSAIIEFLLIVFVLYFFWLLSKTLFVGSTYTLMIVSALFCVVSTIFRSLYVMFTILKLEKKQKISKNSLRPAPSSLDKL